MRPFKFFFGFALAMIAFFFVAKVVFFAAIIAAFMSIVFVIARKIKRFFYHLSWEHEADDYRDHFDRRRRHFAQWNSGVEPLFEEWQTPSPKTNWNRSIPVH